LTYHPSRPNFDRILERLGAGGIGVVYEVEDLKLVEQRPSYFAAGDSFETQIDLGRSGGTSYP
jgi:hypothetical protein